MTLRDKLPYFLSAGAVVLSILACGGDSEPTDPVDPSEPEMCGGIAGFQCSNPDDICVPDVGMCNVADAAGTCLPASDFCTKEYAPVCGCDGKTYSNACHANQAGVGIDSEGACAVTPGDGSGQTCGTRGAGPCPAGETCIHPEGAMCGRTDLPGSCQVLPTACYEIYAPVCGCDGQTYSNDCHANAAGVSVDYVGECLPVGGGGTACGARAGNTCSDTEYCAYKPGEYCGAADAESTCQTRPQYCTYDYTPVCGCDGQTYSNECHANAAGVGIASNGPCASN